MGHRNPSYPLTKEEETFKGYLRIRIELLLKGGKLMKVSLNVEKPGVGNLSEKPRLETKTQKLSFESVLKETKTDPYTELIKLREGLNTGKVFTPQELLRYQITASNFGLRVELVSKVADGLLTSIKKLQNQ